MTVENLKITLAAVRVNAGLTQEELAEMLDVDKKTITNWEKGYTRIDLPWLGAYADACKFPIDNIFLPTYSPKKGKKGEKIA